MNTEQESTLKISNKKTFLWKKRKSNESTTKTDARRFIALHNGKTTDFRIFKYFFMQVEKLKNA